MIVLEVDMSLEAKRHSHADNKLLEPDRACWYAESDMGTRGRSIASKRRAAKRG